MTATELLSRLEALHVELVPAGDRIRFRPASAVSSELRAEIRAYKPELIRMLGSPSETRALAAALPGGVTDAGPSLRVEDVCAMPLDEFARAQLVVEVHSRILEETVVFASDNAVVDPAERRPVYRAAELKLLARVDPQSLRVIHEVKKTFGGTVEPS